MKKCGANNCANDSIKVFSFGCGGTSVWLCQAHYDSVCLVLGVGNDEQQRRTNAELVT